MCSLTTLGNGNYKTVTDWNACSKAADCSG